MNRTTKAACLRHGWMAATIMFCATGCKPVDAPTPRPSAAEAVVSNVADVLTQRQAVQAGQRAKETIRRVSQEHSADLQEAMEGR